MKVELQLKKQIICLILLVTTNLLLSCKDIGLKTNINRYLSEQSQSININKPVLLVLYNLSECSTCDLGLAKEVKEVADSVGINYPNTIFVVDFINPNDRMEVAKQIKVVFRKLPKIIPRKLLTLNKRATITKRIATYQILL